jgi:hypothetical protein
LRIGYDTGDIKILTQTVCPNAKAWSIFLG